MRDFQKNRRWKNILESWPILIILGILVIFFIFTMVGFIGKLQITRENRKIAEQKVAELEQNKERLNSDIDRLKTDEGKEENIREKFGFVKEGEGVIVIVEDKNPPIAEEDSKGGFFNFLKNLFK